LNQNTRYRSGLQKEAVRLEGLLEQLHAGPAPSEVLLRACLEAAHRLADSAEKLGLAPLSDAAASLETALEMYASDGLESDRRVHEAGSRFSSVAHEVAYS
jgi:hypothetical protein